MGDCTVSQSVSGGCSCPAKCSLPPARGRLPHPTWPSHGATFGVSMARNANCRAGLAPGTESLCQCHLQPQGAVLGMGDILVPVGEILSCAPSSPLKPHAGHRGHPHLVPMGKTLPHTPSSHLEPYPGHKGHPHLVTKVGKPPNTPSSSQGTALTCPQRKDPTSDPILVIGVSFHLSLKAGLHLILHPGHRRPL